MKSASRNTLHERSTVRLLILALATAILASSLPSVAVAQSKKPTVVVLDHIWGFDGRVQPGQFNPLAVLLDNQTDQGVEVDAKLLRIQGQLSASGGEYVEPVFIAPAGRRWVLFFPYISNSYQTDWRLTINDNNGGSQFQNHVLENFKQPRPSHKQGSDTKELLPQVVIMDRSGNVTARPTCIKHLPDQTFPPYSTATFGLHTVFLDHVPDWELPRQQAFLSWLKMGGRLHLLKDKRNEVLQFGGELADLNQPMQRFAVGSGVVVRHPLQREAVTENLVKRSVVLDVLQGPLDEIEKELENRINQGFAVGQYQETEPSTIDDSLFRKMRALTFPDHNWGLIFFLALCYIGLIFPGCFLLSKKKHLHFLSTYGAIIGLSVLFSILFLFIGRRGYGESTTLQTLAIARAEGDRHWSVFQWNAFFVTSGNNYTASGPDQQTLFSTANTMEKEPVQLMAGNSGWIQMRIPPFTSQTFVSRRRVASSDWNLKIEEFSAESEKLIGLTIKTGDAFPSEDANRYWVLYGRSIYEMQHNSISNQLQLLGKKEFLAGFCTPDFDYSFMNQWGRRPQDEVDKRTESERFFDESVAQLARRSLLDDLVYKPNEFELPGDRIRLFVYSEIPDEFQLTVSDDARKTGRILFTKDLFLQNQSTDSATAEQQQ